MPPISSPISLESIMKHSDLAVGTLVVLVIMMMVIPIHVALINMFVALNIMMSLTVLLTIIYLKTPTDFSVFPSLLLVTTLFRIALNISTTRKILLEGRAGVEGIITTFGDFVVGGNYIVGIVIFASLVMVQVIVIVRGATRVSEVAARFTLDAMPGKQMSIDADLNSGLITREEADKRREKIRREADFYGAMDGAAKFVSGDVTAGIILTVINIVGGLAIGVWQRDEDLMDALQNYTLLTIGDGLVSQIPSLLISSAMGLIVTRAAAVDNLGKDLSNQLTHNKRAMAVGAGTLLALGIFTPLPFLPFFFAASILGVLYTARRDVDNQEVEDQKKKDEKKSEGPKGPEDVTALLSVELMELEIGYALIPLVDRERGGDLLDRIANIRRRSALDLGIVVPPIRIRDNMQLSPNVYVVKIRGVKVGGFTVYPERYLAMAHVKVSVPVSGESTREPSFNIPSVWIYERDRAKAESAGYTVVDATTVIATHVTEIIKQNAPDLLTRQETQKILEHVKQSSPALVDDALAKVKLGGVQKVLQILLRENVSIRDLVTILEVMTDRADKVPSSLQRAELVRLALGRSIGEGLKEDDGTIHVVTLSPDLEARISENSQMLEDEVNVTLSAREVADIVESFKIELNKLGAGGHAPVVMTSPRVRAAVRQLLAPYIQNIKVISYAEVTSRTISIKTAGSVKGAAPVMG